MIARNLRQGLELPEEQGASYFDRYGDLQRKRWMAFKENMNLCTFSDDEERLIVAKAREMFKYFADIGADIQEVTNQVHH